MSKSRERFHALDSVRGLASLQVIIAHSMVAVPALTWLAYPNTKPKGSIEFYLGNSPLHFFWSDSQAVKVFFVLSGFVLSLPYFTEGKKPFYPKFFIKRIIRLLLPCLAIIAISLGFKELLYKPNSVNMFGGWVQMVWTDHITGKDWLDIVLLKYHYDYIDRSLWTIPPEIKLSLLLPLVILLYKRLNLFLSLVALVIYVGLWHFLNKHNARDLWNEFPTLFYLTFFIIGSYMCRCRLAIIGWVNGLSSAWFYGMIVITILIYTANYTFWWLPAKLLNPMHAASDYIAAVAAILLISIALSQRGTAFFSNSMLQFLGKISFSIYLIHAVVITVMAYVLKDFFAPTIVVGIAFIASFILAVPYYKYIEVPSLNLANKIADYSMMVFKKNSKNQ